MQLKIYTRVAKWRYSEVYSAEQSSCPTSFHFRIQIGSSHCRRHHQKHHYLGEGGIRHPLCKWFINQKERVEIVEAIIEHFTLGKSSSQIRRTCANILIEVIGRHRTFSSGEELLKIILGSGQLLLVYTMTSVPEACLFLIGLLSKSSQTIYNP